MDLVAANYDKHTKIWSGPKIAPLHDIENHSVGRILYGQMRMHPKKVIQVRKLKEKTVFKSSKQITLL